MENLLNPRALRRWLLLAMAGASLGCTASAQAQAAGQTIYLTLDEVFARVAAENPGVQAGEAGVEATRQVMRQRRAALLPQISASAEQGRTRTSVPAQLFDQSASGLIPYTTDNFSATAHASISLIDAEKIANYKAAKLETSAARHEQDAAVQDAYAQAAQLYFAHLRNQSSVRVIESRITLDELLLDMAQQRRAAEVATDLDVTRAQATLARDRQNLLVARTQSTQTRLALLQMLNMDLSAALELAPREPQEPFLDPSPNLEALLESRPEYQAAVETLRRNKVASKAASWQRFPNVTVSGDYGITSETVGDGNDVDYWAVALSLRMPIWEGGRISAEKLQARALIRQQQFLISQLSNAIRSDYHAAVEAVQQRWEELPYAREAVRLSDQELRYARERFEAGVADNSDVVDAQASLAEANDSLVDAEYRYYLARIDLARVLGRVAEEMGR